MDLILENDELKLKLRHIIDCFDMTEDPPVLEDREELAKLLAQAEDLIDGRGDDEQETW